MAVYGAAIACAVAALTAFTTHGASAATVDFDNDSILVIAPHPDDDVITAAGIISRASDVRIAYITNGDYCETLDSDADTAYCGSADPDIP